MKLKKSPCPASAWFITLFMVTCAGAQGTIEFNRDIRPILSERCFHCHGPDAGKRKAKLRLDIRESALEMRDGVAAIVPGDLQGSELHRRISTRDEDDRMPPSDSNKKPLNRDEVELIAGWIQSGAQYEGHWGFRKPQRPKVPGDLARGHNEIDRFIHARLGSAGLKPQVPASREELLRRVTLDVTGLPPTVRELDAFLSDKGARSYEKVVDRLLTSPHYGERMAMWWLDGARYGDSHGYDNDLENSQWPWRDWVVKAFNDNKPFNDFTIEQLAGDLLPEPDNKQVLATAFNRNHRINTEDGAIDLEWRTEYVIDRVETMGTVWMGLTMGCARCHDHKYDPISQKEFYQLFAFFNTLDEKGFINNLRGSAEPRLSLTGNPKVQVMVMRDMAQPRKNFLLLGGQYDAPGEEVGRGLPAVLPPMPEGEAMNRLGLARWLVGGEHPLVSRVLVNRLWEQFFGTGIVKTVEDMGVQADWPSHPGLLDWLAVDFQDSGWDIKRLLKQMLMSSTYRQSHVVDQLRLEKDPGNRLLSRGPRIRLQAEMIRDQALALSGLLSMKMGGPGVRPYQPVGLWKEVEKRGKYQQHHGPDLYRRSIYTMIRRTVPPPGMRLFDMPSRETCTLTRPRTNTPLQALALMNNVTYVEAARKFAERMMGQGGAAEKQIAWGFRCATQRQAGQGELQLLVDGYRRRLARYREIPGLAESLLKQGESESPEIGNPEALASMTTVASLLLNLDETINK